MSIKNNIAVINNLVNSNDPAKLEKFLSYCDTRDELIRSYIKSNGSSELLNLCKEFKAKGLREKINITCDSNFL